MTPPAPVLVVGAGPVGLSAALALRAHDLPVTLLEGDPEGRERPGSRALFVHRETLELLEGIHPGLAVKIASYGRTWHTRRTLYRGREVYSRTFPPPAGTPPFTSLRQVDTERFLLAACRDAGVEFVWDARIAAVTTDPDGVRLTAEDGRTWTGVHAVAADGARSAVRRELGIPMEGTHGEGFHVVADIADLPGAELPLERVFHYEHPALGRRSVMRVPFTGGFQVDLQCRDDDAAQEFGTEEAVRRWLPEVVGDGYAERVLWVSTYRFLRKVAAAFTDPHRRVLLAGEAAHLFPPFGARGMNSGIADAVAAARAIADGTPAAVDSFAEVRRSAGLFNSAAAGTALDHLRPRRRIVRVKQRAAAALAPLVPRCGAWLEHAPYGPRHGSPAVAGRKY
ncbi:FAD-dependent monooxygenase [Streptomyces scabiei]|uniref:FAD-dependent monooxygenase n=3 Tax=Streptomyces scabiei TaxID=1930 RepID=UPI0029BE2D44|nr:FAD-dependent monooxygenase [Streptomyces scabiei]MDX2536603.1 FAD-dependent monooxygenase [Streptomyces scabiei]MDX2801640.1 FAD-dependent monooxygenase [Streptomyces scabiei]MDX3826069.1 FAD-dependent monooxygenase [Streptomyces scabiei]